LIIERSLTSFVVCSVCSVFH